MFAENFDQWMKMNKNAALPLHEFNKTLTDLWIHVSQQNAKVASDYFALLSDQFKRLSTVNRPEEFFTLQRECMNEHLSAYMDCMQKFLKTTTDNMEKLSKYLTPIVAENISTAGSQRRQKEKTA